MSNYIKGADGTLYDPVTKEPVGRLGQDGNEHLFGASMVNPANPTTQFTDKSGTPGAATINTARGRAAIAAGASSVTITNSRVSASSMIVAHIDQASADGTLTSIQRITCGAGTMTIYGNANATAAVSVRFQVLQ